MRLVSREILWLTSLQVLNYGRHYNLEQKVKDLGGYLEGKKEVLGQVDRTGRLPPEVLHAFRQSGGWLGRSQG